MERNISPVFTASDRLAAVRVGTSYGNVLVVAVYMPVDYGDSDSLSQLGCLESLLESDEYIGTVVLGDFNADLCQMKSHSARQLGTFVAESNLTVVGINDQARLDDPSTWHRSDFSAHSWIDYFIVSKSLKRMVAVFEILEDGMIMSDHWPIMMSVEVRVDLRKESDNLRPQGGRLLWT